MYVREDLFRILARVAETLGLGGVDFSLAPPRDSSHGDYASNIALVAAKARNENPMTLAERITQTLREEKPDGVAGITATPPGFVNITLAPEIFVANLSSVLEQGAGYGRGDALSGRRVMREYTDPNPFKEFHIGHLMSNAIGEALARLMDFGGAEVRRANYQGDIGLHVAKAIWKLRGRHFLDEELSPEDGIQRMNDAYIQGNQDFEYNTSAVRAQIHELNRTIYEQSNPEINKIYKKGRDLSLRYFEEIYRRLGTIFDEYFFESETGPRGKALVEEYLVKGVFEKSDSAVIFRGEEEGLHTRVFLTAGGLPTYEAKDIGLAFLKQERWPSEQSFSVTGNEIAEYFKVVRAALRHINPELAEKIVHIPHGMLRFKDAKMSSRKGNVVSATTFLDEVKTLALDKMRQAALVAQDRQEAVADDIAIAAVKYAILKQSIGRDIIFDPDSSLSFEGDSGPYVQYAHARACAVLAKAAATRLQPSVASPETPGKTERLLFHFPEVAASALADRAPHVVCTYLVRLAQTFNHYYAQTPILQGGDAASYRLALAAGVKTVLARGLALLGIAAPERM